MLLFDWPLWGLAAIYFVLSFAMQQVINRMPLFCSFFWPFIAVWGICWTVIGCGLATTYWWPDSTVWEFIARLTVVFIALCRGNG